MRYERIADHLIPKGEADEDQVQEWCWEGKLRARLWDRESEEQVLHRWGKIGSLEEAGWCTHLPFPISLQEYELKQLAVLYNKSN